MKFASGDVYDGEWKDGKKDGQGGNVGERGWGGEGYDVGMGDLVEPLLGDVTGGRWRVGSWPRSRTGMGKMTEESGGADTIGLVRAGRGAIEAMKRPGIDQAGRARRAGVRGGRAVVRIGTKAGRVATDRDAHDSQRLRRVVRLPSFWLLKM